MTWKSRIDKEPPAQFWADVLAYLYRSYPGALFPRERMEELKPFFVNEWRNGQTAHDAAKATCSCDGREIVPSPATQVLLAKGAVRPPKGAVRGRVFGIDELREPSRLAKVRVSLALAQRKAEHEEKKAGELAAKLETARKDGVKLRLRSQLDRATAAAQEHRAEEQRLREQLNALLEWQNLSLPSGSASVPPIEGTRARSVRKEPAKTARRPSKGSTAEGAEKNGTKNGAKKEADCGCKVPPATGTVVLPPASGSTSASDGIDLEALVNQFAAASAKDRGKRA